MCVKSQSQVSRLLNILLQNGGYAVQFVETYFDESGSHNGSPVLCVAGYIIEKDACVQLDQEWKRVLDEYELPYFRMSSCAHGTKPFDVLSPEQRIAVEKEMIAIMRQHITYGIAVTVQPWSFEALIPKNQNWDDPYTMCAHTCLLAVRNWANQNQYNGKIAYFFESGHRSQSSANSIMDHVFNDPGLRALYRYSSHTFADKKDVRPLQAADLIAWQWFTDEKLRLTKRADHPRADCYELMRGEDGATSKYHVLHLNPEKLRGMAKEIMRREYPLTFPG